LPLYFHHLYGQYNNLSEYFQYISVLSVNIIQNHHICSNGLTRLKKNNRQSEVFCLNFCLIILTQSCLYSFIKWSINETHFHEILSAIRFIREHIITRF